MRTMSMGVVAAIVAISLSGCASMTARTAGSETAPAASIPAERITSLAGHWQGVISETAGWYYQASKPADIVLNADGTWTGKIGDERASGVARMSGRRLVLSGTTWSPDGHQEAFYLSLTGDDSRLWAQTLTLFNEREARASVSLRRVPPPSTNAGPRG
jgi:uncharacterized protein YceK